MSVHNSNTWLQNEYNKTNYQNNILLKVLADTVEFRQQFISEGICKKEKQTVLKRNPTLFSARAGLAYTETF